jgi:tRNA(Ile2) C34 agmatinyltransferase TiaS
MEETKIMNKKILKREVVVVNKAQCKLCGDVIESKHGHDFVRCKCGEIAVDGGKNYLRRSAKNLDNIIELSETYEEEYEAQW